MMMKKLNSRIILGFFLLLGACFFSSQQRDIQNGEKALSEGHGLNALTYYEKATHGPDQGLALEAARRAAAGISDRPHL